LIFLNLLFASCAVQPKTQIFDPFEQDRLIVYIEDEPSLRVELKIDKYPFVKTFNQCIKHLQKEYEDSKVTKKSLMFCQSNVSLDKIDGKLYFKGNINLYKGSSMFKIFGEENQTFDKVSVGKMTDFNFLINGLETKGTKINEGYNSIVFEKRTIFIYLKKNTLYKIKEK